MPTMKLIKGAYRAATSASPKRLATLYLESVLKGFIVLMSGRTDAKTYVVTRAGCPSASTKKASSWRASTASENRQFIGPPGKV